MERRNNVKRLVDILLSLVGLFILAPLFFLVALAVLTTDGKPVLFKQQRVGRQGKDFFLYKFRSMRVLKAAELGSFDAGSDRRVTKIGRLLRRTKLDELPQLWNVLKGDMSLVGPRPEVRKWVEVYPERWQNVLTIRPGITDPASIKFRNEEELLAAAEDPEQTYRNVILPQKLSMYEQYVKHASFLGDMGIILKTILAVAKN